MWVFGYGSLIWKADFPYSEVRVGHIKGYVRRFYQKSTDHRGIPSRPGRVVTLLSSDDPNDQVWGVAYRIPPDNIENVVKHLDYREKGGYERKSVLFYPSHSINDVESHLVPNGYHRCLSNSESKPFYITIYIGGEDNPNYAGTENIHMIAQHIVESCGPSGSNKEYLYKLASAMREIAPDVNDEHLYTLEKIVKTLEREREDQDKNE